jgi:hypothetical protein
LAEEHVHDTFVSAQGGKLYMVQNAAKQFTVLLDTPTGRGTLHAELDEATARKTWIALIAYALIVRLGNSKEDALAWAQQHVLALDLTLPPSEKCVPLASYSSEPE